MHLASRTACLWPGAPAQNQRRQWVKGEARPAVGLGRPRQMNVPLCPMDGQVPKPARPGRERRNAVPAGGRGGGPGAPKPAAHGRSTPSRRPGRKKKKKKACSLFVEFVDVIAKHGGDAHAGDDDALGRVALGTDDEGWEVERGKERGERGREEGESAVATVAVGSAEGRGGGGA